MRVTNSMWFSTMNNPRTIGIVIGVDEVTAETKAYIGIGQGLSQKEDEINISQYGSSFPMCSALTLFG